MYKIKSIALILIGLIGLSISCDQRDSNQLRAVEANCASCHLRPEASHLSTEVWEKRVLPEMANYFVWNEASIHYKYANKTFYNKKGQLPMDDKTWGLILDYFTEYANEDSIRTSITPSQNFFDEEVINFKSSNLPQITALNMDANGRVRAAGRIENANKSAIFLFSNQNIIDTFYQGEYSVISQILPLGLDSMMLLDMGEIIPHDQALGSIYTYQKGRNESNTLIAGLKRPVHVTQSGDQLVISEFGHISGSVNMYSATEDGYKKQLLLNLPGCYKSKIFDDHVYVMCSQAREGIYKINLLQPDLSKVILNFPPEFGLSDMDIVDINGDGLSDIIVTNGDNADYSIQPKDYHGLRVYLNNGDNTFDEDYFYPMYGATQLNILDINGDEYLDLVVSSYFAVNQNESIQILVNQGGNDNIDFGAYSVAESSKGRWIVMTSGDYDQDGDDDILLGNNVAGPTQINEVERKSIIENSVEFLLLKNRLK